MARIGGVGKVAREVEELRVKWIWNSWSGARESGRRARVASNAVHGELREEKERRARRRRKVRQVVAREGVVVDLAASPTAKQRGDALDGHARLRERRCHYCEPCVTGRNREKGDESMTCGVHM